MLCYMNPPPAKRKVDTLDHLPSGKSCEILSLSNQSGTVKRRLIDMGLTPGTCVTLVKIAPFGDPMELSLRGYEMSLRKADAAQITVRLLREGETLRERPCPMWTAPSVSVCAAPTATKPLPTPEPMMPPPTTPVSGKLPWRAIPTAAKPPCSTL